MLTDPLDISQSDGGFPGFIFLVWSHLRLRLRTNPTPNSLWCRLPHYKHKLGSVTSRDGVL